MSDLDVNFLVTDEDAHHRQESSHASSFSSSSSSLWSCPALRKSSESRDESFCPEEERTAACALQMVSMETNHHSDSERKQEEEEEEEEEGPSDAEIQLFSEKCSRLQCFVPPLSSILHSLQAGRYSHRLSSFQERIATDRIQRILGVLQKPDTSSARFLGLLLKIEEMLQKWFPHIQLTPPPNDEDTPTKRMKHHYSSSSSFGLLWLHTSPICSLTTPDVSPSDHAYSSSPTQDASVSSSTDSPRRLPSTQLLKVSSPCLQRLLLAKESTSSPHKDGAAPS